MATTSIVEPGPPNDLPKIEKGESSSDQHFPPTPVRVHPLSRAFLLGPVKSKHADLPLLACCLCTGMTDAACFANWSTFVGMQTGNTVILGLSASSLPPRPYTWLSTLVSITSYLTGCYVTFRVARRFAPKDLYSNRLLFVSLFFIQSLLLFLAASLATVPGLIPQIPPSAGTHAAENKRVLASIEIVALIPPLAIESGFQIACSRLLGFNELPVNVLTSLYCDTVGDPDLFARHNVKRNRRVAAIVLLLLGAIISGWLMRSAGGLASVFWVAGGIKITLAITILCFMPVAEHREASHAKGSEGESTPRAE